MNFLAVLRRIRRCENEVAAQVVFEHAIAQAIDAEREACAKVCEAIGAAATLQLRTNDISGAVVNACVDVLAEAMRCIRERSKREGNLQPREAARSKSAPLSVVRLTGVLEITGLATDDQEHR